MMVTIVHARENIQDTAENTSTTYKSKKSGPSATRQSSESRTFTHLCISEGVGLIVRFGISLVIGITWIDKKRGVGRKLHWCQRSEYTHAKVTNDSPSPTTPHLARGRQGRRPTVRRFHDFKGAGSGAVETGGNEMP